MRKILTVALYLLLTIFQTFGQKDDYSSSIPAAVRSFEAALKSYQNNRDAEALEYADRALQHDPKFIEAHMLRANIMSDMKKYGEAIAAYKSAIEINADFFPNNFYSLGRIEFLTGNYEAAKEHLTKFLSFPKINKTLAFRAKQILQSSDFAANAIKNPVPFQPVNMGDSINSSDEEYFPSVTADGQTILFTRRLLPNAATGNHTEQEDFYISHMKDKRWQIAKSIKEINTEGNEGASSLSSDGQYIFFTACQEMYESMNAYKTKGSCDLFLAKKAGDKFSKPRNLETPVNTGTWESQPSFSSDGRTLYFVRKVKGADNQSSSDIYITSISDSGEWSTPVPLNETINTPGDEMSVFIHPDNQTLYFSSNGHPGMGGLDIFFSRRQDDGSWGTPENIGYPINSTNDENSFLVSPDGKIAYFASDKEGGRGGLDLYSFPLYEGARPVAVTYMKGKVFDATSTKPLEANFELIDLVTGKTVVSSSSNIVNGEFLVCLPTGKRYALNVSKDGYLFYSENFELKFATAANQPVNKDIPLQPIEIGKSIILKNVFYDFDKYELREDSKVELGKLVTFLNKYPKVKFEISGHTDNMGGKEYNQKLSEQRAKSVYEYLVSKNIESGRLVYKGYGDTKPVADNSTESGRAQNRRTEFVVISVN
jgi:outer membrane protein OmpA-like peptidoglycan-associated protein/tetratricopeptide (TPR) repeat protein